MDSELIEQAENAVLDAWDERAKNPPVTESLASAAVRAALAVFEAAQKPADDEREALAVLISEYINETDDCGDLPKTRGLAEQIIDGLRRPVSQASSDPEGEGSSPWREIQDAKDLLTEAYGPGEWVPEPQTEPTDVQVIAALAAHRQNWGDPKEAMRSALRAALNTKES